MARVGIFGGTFDPIHLGHLICAEQARDVASLDKVIFIPVADPAFPKRRRISPAWDRMQMCSLALEGNPFFELSSIDIERGGITYTVDTLRQLHKTLPAGTELFFITGSDAAITLPQWHEADELCCLAHFLVIERPGCPLTGEHRKMLAHAGFQITVLTATSVDVSSTQVRDRVSRGLSIRYLTPHSVCGYIVGKGLYKGGA